MTIHTTGILLLPYPDGLENVSLGPADFQNIVQILDAGGSGPVVSRVTSGTLAARPAAASTPLGSLYVCTDVAAMFLLDGSGSWRFIPTTTSGDVPIGGMTQYGGASDPVDVDGITRWILANGRAISRTTYPTAFARLGTTFGAGDGSTTFNIPNMQNQVPIGAGSTYSLGSTYGEAAHALTALEGPNHAHSLSSSGSNVGFNDPGHVHGAAGGGNLLSKGAGVSNLDISIVGGGNVNQPAFTALQFTGAYLSDPGHSHTVVATGSNIPHNNIQPSLGVQYIVRVL